MPFLTYQETAPDAWVELGLRHARPHGGTAPRPTDGAISAPRGWSGLHARDRDRALAGTWRQRLFRDRQEHEPDTDTA